MLTPALEKQRQQLFAQTVTGMTGKLATVTDSASMFTALRWGMEELDQAYATTPTKIRATVACRAGCGHCCSVPVEVQAHEVFLRPSISKPILLRPIWLPSSRARPRSASARSTSPTSSARA